MAEAEGLGVVVEGDDHVDPVPGRGERHLERRDDAGGAVGAVDLLGGVGAQLQDARLFLDGHDAHGDDVAGLAQAAIGHRADAARAAGDEAADRRQALRRGVHAQLKALRAGLGVDRDHLPPGADAHEPGLDPLDRVERRHVEDDPTLERHRLPVVAGAGAAHDERDAGLGAGRGGADHLGLVARRHDHLGELRLELLVEHRAVPEIVARLALHRHGVAGRRHVAEGGEERVPIVEEALQGARNGGGWHAERGPWWSKMSNRWSCSWGRHSNLLMLRCEERIRASKHAPAVGRCIRRVASFEARSARTSG